MNYKAFSKNLSLASPRKPKLFGHVRYFLYFCIKVERRDPSPRSPEGEGLP